MEGKNALALEGLPVEVLLRIFSFCDSDSLMSFAEAYDGCGHVADLACEEAENALQLKEKDRLLLEDLPSEILLNIFSYLDWSNLGRLARVSRRFRSLAYAESLWLRSAREAIATTTASARKTDWLTSRDKVRISLNWERGCYAERQLLVQNVRYMPRMQLEEDLLWVSWGRRIWAHKRCGLDGTISRTTTRVLKGHTDDVSRFVVKDGMVVSGGRDRNLVAWDSHTGDFLFAKRYCHGSEVSAVDVVRRHLVATGSRDGTMKLWNVEDCNSNTNYRRHHSNCPTLVSSVGLGDRIWALAAAPHGRKIAIGSAGLCGVPSLHLLDLETSGIDGTKYLEPLGRDLKRGAGVLDLLWHSENTFLSCGYDAFARLWDTRVGGYVRKWEEPFDEAIYCLCTDGRMTLLCGTARHGLVRLWDMRCSQPIQFFYARPAHRGQSSPVYSVAADQTNLYLALDQSLNLLSFVGLDNLPRITR